MSHAVLRVQDLVTHFPQRDGNIHAVDGVTFELMQGETLCIVGESGCGKSVLVRSIVRLLPRVAVSTGVVKLEFEGSEINLLSESSKSQLLRRVRGRHFGMVFQDPMNSLSPVHKVGSQIEESLQINNGLSSNAARGRVIELLEQVGIPEAAERVNDYPHQLSGGMRQRVMIAMAIATEPAILIADEPTTALDVSVQAQILARFKRLQTETKMGTIFVSHDLAVVSSIADRIIVMYLGVVVEIGTAKEITEAPQHPYTRLLLASTPRIDLPKSDQPLAVIPGFVPTPKGKQIGCRFFSRCPVGIAGICDRDEPELLQTSSTHAVRCVRASEEYEIFE